jgi:hypothetical protein
MNPNEPNFTEESNSNAAAASAEKAWETAKAKAEEGYQAGEQYVREHPGSSVLTVFGVGFIIGVLVGWAAAHEEDDSYWGRFKGATKGLRRNLQF